MINIIWVKLKDYKDSLPMILSMTVLALVMIYIFGRGFSGEQLTKIGIVDLDQTTTSKRFVDTLEGLQGYEVSLYATEEEGISAAKNGKIVSLLVVEKDFSQRLLVGEGGIIHYRDGQSIEHLTLEANLQTLGQLFGSDQVFINNLSGLMQEVGSPLTGEMIADQLKVQSETYPMLGLKTETRARQEKGGYDSMKHSFIGFILFFSMFTMVFGIGSIVQEKENKVWDRLSVAPVSKLKLYLANILASLMVGMAQLSFMVVFSRYVFGLEWGGSMIALLLVLAAFVLAVSALGLFLANMASTMQQLGSFSPIVIVSTSMLGGCMWPLEIINNKFLLLLADLTPQRWAYLGLKEVIILGGGFNEVGPALIRLGVMTLILLVIASVPYGKLVGLNVKKIVLSD